MTDEEALEYWEKIRKTFMEHYESEDSYWGRHHWMTSVQAVDAVISALRDRIAHQNPQLLTLDELRNHYITCHDCDDAEYSTTVTCGYVCRSKSSPCRGRVTVGYDFCSYGRRKPELPERAEK
ncbi:hypothetical protein DSECCO2_427300 [anaerobic digester metagenome]